MKSLPSFADKCEKKSEKRRKEERICETGKRGEVRELCSVITARAEEFHGVKEERGKEKGR